MGTPEPRLTVELVPSAQWGANLSKSLKGKRWDTVRKETYRRAGSQCEVCGGVGKRHAVEAHEVWSYDEVTGVQRLDRLVALCPACHEVKHIGRAQQVGRFKEAASHLAEVNRCSANEARAYLATAREEWRRRNEISWTLDLSGLEEYGIEPPTTEELAQGRLRAQDQIRQERQSALPDD